jgi:hypothetical protein
MSPRRNWDFPNPSLASECAPLPRTAGGGGGPHSDDWRKKHSAYSVMRRHVPKVVSEIVPEVEARWFLPARRSFMLILFIFLYI